VHSKLPRYLPGPGTATLRTAPAHHTTTVPDWLPEIESCRDQIKYHLCYNDTANASCAWQEVAPINKAEKRFQLAGWLLFLVCAVLFIAQGLTDNNLLGLIGSIVFFVGCVAFLIPLVGNWHR